MYNDRPPCRYTVIERGELITCDKIELDPENNRALELYNILSSRDRPGDAMGGLRKLPTMSVLQLCVVYDETVETFEKILTLDNILYPALIASSGDSNGSKDPNKH